MSEFQTLFTVIERCCPFSSLLSSSSLSACKCLSIYLPALLSLCIVLYPVPLPQNVIMIIFQESGASRGAKVSTNQQYNTGTRTHTHTHLSSTSERGFCSISFSHHSVSQQLRFISAAVLSVFQADGEIQVWDYL